MRGLWIIGWLGLSSGLGCERPERTRCALNEASAIASVASASVTSFDAIALASRGTDLVAAWSDNTGAWLARLDGKSAPQRIGASCAGGIALALHEKLWVACSRLAQTDLPGEAVLLRVAAKTLRVEAEYVLGAVGREAGGVALTLSQNTALMAWGDGQVGAPRVLLREAPLAGGAPTKPARALSAADANGRTPSLFFQRGQLWQVWVESDLAPGKSRHRLMIARGDGPPERLSAVGSDSPLPTLAADELGVVIAYRTANKPGAREELMLGRLDARGRFAAPPRSIGRANSVGGPSLALCTQTRGAAVPIDHAGELYVAFHPLSPALRTTEENHQYYESKREFVRVALACLGDHPVALLAERTEAAQPAARLLRTDFHCAR